MKHIFSCVVVCLIVIILSFGIKFDTAQRELEAETNIRLLQFEERIEEQEKQIRIMRQDMDILENGYERSTEN